MANTPADLIEDVTEDGCRICRENKRDMLLEQYYMIHNKQCSSVITSKAANGYHFKTGQRIGRPRLRMFYPAAPVVASRFWYASFGGRT